MKTIAIVPSAGIGRRLGMKTKKPFVLLKGKPIIYYTLRALNRCRDVDSIALVAEKCSIAKFAALVKKNRFEKVRWIVAGGKTRFQSVKNGLRVADPFYDIVLVHDGARPFLTERMISDSIRTAARFGGAVTAIPASDTIKLADRTLFIRKTLDRNTIYCAQTPQAFRRSIILNAYSMTGGKSVTDDSGLVEMLGRRVKIIEGSHRNIKITTKEDLKIAKELL